MYIFAIVLHVILCICLILVILLQPGKGADAGSAFGGGMASMVFGPRASGNLLTRATAIVAALFMVTSVTLAIYSDQSIRSGTDINDTIERLQKEQEGTSPDQEPTTDLAPSGADEQPGAAAPVGDGNWYNEGAAPAEDLPVVPGPADAPAPTPAPAP